jgi:hypothetical protein
MEIGCAAVLRELSGYVDRDLDSELHTRIASHLKQCRDCTAILDGILNVVLLFGDGLFELPAGFSNRLREKLVAKGLGV